MWNPFNPVIRYATRKSIFSPKFVNTNNNANNNARKWKTAESPKLLFPRTDVYINIYDETMPLYIYI